MAIARYLKCAHLIASQPQQQILDTSRAAQPSSLLCLISAQVGCRLLRSIGCEAVISTSGMGTGGSKLGAVSEVVQRTGGDRREAPAGNTAISAASQTGGSVV